MAGIGRFYPWLLALHIVLAAVWVGGSLVVQLLILRARGARDEALQRSLFALSNEVRERVITPSAGSLLGVGAALVIIGEWGYRTPWVVIGLAGFIASFAVGMMASRADGERAVTLANVELAILAVMVLDMTMKPG